MAVKALKCIRCGPAAHEDWVSKATIDVHGGSENLPVARYVLSSSIEVCGTIQFGDESSVDDPNHCIGCYSSCTACLSA